MASSGLDGSGVKNKYMTAGLEVEMFCSIWQQKLKDSDKTKVRLSRGR